MRRSATMGGVTLDEVRTRYGHGDWYRIVALGGVGLMAVGMVAAMVAVVLDGEACMLACLIPAAAVWTVVSSISLWRRPYRLELHGDRLLWYAPLRRGWLPVRHIYVIEREGRVRLHQGPRCVMFRPFDGVAFALPQYLNLAPFLESLLAVEPRIRVLPAAWARELGVPEANAGP